MDHTGCYMFIHVRLGKNGWEGFTGSPLQLSEGDFFTIIGYCLVVHLKGMVDSFAHTRTQEMIQIRFITT